MSKRKMQKIVSEKDHYKSADTINLAGGKAWSMDVEERLIQVLHTGTIESTYYTSQEKITSEAIDIFEAAPVDMMEKWIPKGRNEGFMRTSPILALTILFESDTKAAQRIFNSVIRTGNDLTAFIDARRARGFGYGRGIKKAINSWLAIKLTEFYAIKYGNDITHGIRLARPTRKILGETSAKIADYLMTKIKDNELKIPENLIKLQAFEDLKSLKQRGNATIEEINTLVQRGRLDYTVVTGIGFKMTPELWISLSAQMGVFALLRHLKTFEKNDLHKDKNFVNFLFGHDVIKANSTEMLIHGRLTAENLTRAKVFPFRVWQAWMAVTSDVFKSKLGDLMDEFIPQYDFSEWGKVCICPDVSGSMTRETSNKTTMRYVDIAAMFAGVLYKGIEGSKIIPFDTEVYPSIIPSRSSKVIDIIKPIIDAGGMGTYMELPIAYLNGTLTSTFRNYRRSKYSKYSEIPERTPKKFDTFIYITDGMEWGGGLLKQWIVYKKFHPKAKLVLIRIDAYGQDPYSQEHQKKYDIIQTYGWNSSVIDFIRYMLSSKGKS